jgi:hypothetical protein
VAQLWVEDAEQHKQVPLGELPSAPLLETQQAPSDYDNYIAARRAAWKRAAWKAAVTSGNAARAAGRL